MVWLQNAEDLVLARCLVSANRRAGWYLIVSCGAALCFSLVFWTTHRDWPEERLILWMANAFPVALIFACIASFLYLAKAVNSRRDPLAILSSHQARAAIEG